MRVFASFQIVRVRVRVRVSSGRASSDMVSFVGLWSVMVRVGLLMVRAWSVYGPCMVRVWSVYGLLRSVL